MGKHAKSNNEGHAKDVYWDAGASPAYKAANFDAYDKHLTDNAPEDKSNPYSEENFGK